MDEYIEQIMAKSYVMGALAAHYGLDYGTTLTIAEAHRRRALGLPPSVWEGAALESARSELGSAHGGFRNAMETIMIRRFGQNCRLVN